MNKIIKKARRTFEKLRKSEESPEESVESLFDNALNELEAVNKSEETPDEIETVEDVEPVVEEVNEFEDENLEKSISDHLNDDAEMGEAVDVEPMLKAIVDATDKAVSGHNKTIVELKKSISSLTGLITKMSKVQIAEGKLLKSMMVDVQEVADMPNERQGQLSINERFEESEEVMSKAEATEKLESLIKSKQLSNEQCYTVEQRINRGQDMPEWFNNMQVKGEK